MNEQVTLLVYGDSLTWGMDPSTHDRLPKKDRWTSVLQAELGSTYDIISEGLRSRMFGGENPYKSELDGYVQYGPILGSHLPVDIVIVMLGTNDCSAGAGKSAADISENIERYVEKTHQWAKRCHVQTPKMIFISPHHIIERLADDSPEHRFQGSEEKSKQLAAVYKSAAQRSGADFFDAAKHIVASDVDGIHLDGENNAILGREVARFIKNLY